MCDMVTKQTSAINNSCYFFNVLHASDAVRTNTGFKNTEFADIIKVIMAWLRNSGDREGGRKRRRETKVRKQTNMILELQQQVRDQQKLLHEQQMEVLTNETASSDIDDPEETLQPQDLCVRSQAKD